MILALAIASAILSAIPAAMFLANLPLFCQSISGDEDPQIEGGVSVLIPARDEEAGIADCIHAALESEGVSVEVIVLDDDSDDSTARIVTELAEVDHRVKLVSGRPLPGDWNGKQHACMQLAESASYDQWVFIDADVRLLKPCLRNLSSYLQRNRLGLLSAFPHQVTLTWAERWWIPMMHFILLGYLPFARMRSDSSPGFAAGCGQLFFTTREAYQKAGTHAAIRASRHDGIKLPRAYRTAGLMTDVIDGTELAHCRMYVGARQVIRGMLKNATEGIANPRLIVVFTVVLLGCSLLPVLAMLAAAASQDWLAAGIAACGLIMAHIPRFIAAMKLRQSWFGAVCHVPATVLFVALQWMALAGQLFGVRVSWRGRSQ